MKNIFLQNQNICSILYKKKNVLPYSTYLGKNIFICQKLLLNSFALHYCTIERIECKRLISIAKSDFVIMSIVKSVSLDVKISRGWRTCLPWRLWRSVLLSLPFYISTYIAIYLAILFPLSSICLHPIYCIFFFFTFTFTFATRPDRLANYDLYLTDLSAPSNLT